MNTGISRRALLAAAIPLAAQAQTAWPDRTIRLLVGFAAGGSADVIARLLARALTDRLGRPVVVENRAGAGGRIAAQAVAQAEPDGYTLLFGSTAIPVQMALDPTPGYDPPTQLLPIAPVAEAPNILVANRDLPVRTVQDLVAYARTRPQGINFASSGAGTSLHLAGELLRQRSGAPMSHVPYRGSGPALTALISGEVQFMFDSLATAAPHVAAGTLRPLAVTTAARTPLLPDVPTMAEAGFADFDISVWFGVFAPRALPAAIAARLATEIAAARRDPQMTAQLTALSSTVLDSEGPAAFERFVLADIARWQGIVRSTGVRVAN
jgi:tripartite-type tricarboxylate transporter receptor subunit TctC